MRKSIVSELQTEEVAAANSPVRRSSRIVNANITPAGITTRRTSQTTESDTPAKVTRGRRASTQAAEEKVETKTAISKRASILVEDISQKEPTTPARRGRKPSVTSETTDKETEKPKPTRGRRPSVTKSEDNEEEKPQKSAPVRSRRSSAAIDPESEVKPASKTPARATTRRRSSAAENALVEEVSTPSQRPTRGRRASDAAEVVEEAKKPVTRGRRKSVNVEETVVEEVTKPAPRRSRRTSTDDVVTNTAPKTPVRSTRRSLINLEPESKDIATNDKEGVDEDELSPISLKQNIVLKVTPLKKRKIVEKIESELDLSIINESADDINISKNESLKEIDKKESPGKAIENVLVMSPAKDLVNVNISQPAILSKISESRDNSPSSRGSPISRKRLSTGVEESPPRKSPRLSEKSRSNTPQKELTAAEPSPRKSPRLSDKTHSTNTPQKETYPQGQKSSPQKTSENAEKEYIQESHVPKLHGSCVSSGSDGSFRFHLSTVSMADSAQSSEIQEDLLNTSKDSTGSNKENIEVTDCTKSVNKSVVIPIQEPIIVSRVSNVFKPNQRECSFMEPMDVDESLMLADSSILNKSVASDESSVIFTKNATKYTGGSASESTNNSEQEEPSIVLCNNFLTNDNATGVTATNDKNLQENPDQLLHKLQSAEFSSKFSCTETEGSDNILIEETEGTVYMCVKPTPNKLLVTTSTSPIKRQSRSSTNIEASLILNDPIDKVKVLLSRKSSSPLNIKRRSLRKSKSPLDNNDSTDSENEEKDRLRVSKPTRRSKTPSPLKDYEQIIVPRISKSPSAKRVSDLKQGDVNQAELATRKSRAKSKSPVPVSHSDKADDKGVRVLSNLSPIKRNILSISPGPGSDEKQAKSPGYYNDPTLTGNRAARSKSKSPLPQTAIRGIMYAANKSPVLDRSVENPRESEEILISNEKIVFDASINTKNSEKVEESIVKTLGLNVEESSNQKPHFDQSVPVETTNADQTEYHTATAITNNDTEFNSIINTDNDITQSGGKHSESTHYDFDMPSDDDDLLLESKDSTGDKPVNSSILNKSRGDDKVPSRKSAGNVSESLADDSENVAEKLIENKAPSSTSLIDSDSEDDVFEENQNADLSVNVKQVKLEILNDKTELDTSKVNDIEIIQDICENNVEIITDCETSSKPDKEGSDDDLSHPSNECPKKLPVLPKVRNSLNEAKTDLENTFSQDNEVIEANNETPEQNKNESELVPEKEVTKPNDVSAETNIGDSESVPETKEVTEPNDVSAETNIGDSESVSETKEVTEPNDVSAETNIGDSESVPETKEVTKPNDVSAETNIDDSESVPVAKDSHKKKEVVAHVTVESENELSVSSSSSVDIIESISEDVTSVSDVSNVNNKNLSEIENTLKLSNNLKEDTTGPENEKLDKTQEDIATCNITKKAEKMETQSFIGKSPSAKDRDSESVKSRPSLDKFTSAKPSQYPKSKDKGIEESSSDEEIDEDGVDEEESESEKENSESVKSRPSLDEFASAKRSHCLKFKDKEIEESSSGEEIDEDGVDEEESKSEKEYSKSVKSRPSLDEFASAKRSHCLSHCLKSKDKEVEESSSDEDGVDEEESKSEKEYSKSVKSRPSLDEFASAKLSHCLKSKDKDIEESSSDEEGVDEEESKSEKEYSKLVKSRPSLDEFASAKLSEYIKSKAKEIKESSSDEEIDEDGDEEESESEKEYNIFIDGMAEEGEEDTPSEDSNEIVDEGESIGSSDSDDAALDDDYDGNDSFICDEDDVGLLSGEEYDLSNEKKTKSKKSRIINPDTLGDEDIIVIPKKKANKEKPKRKSRIIKVSDSSEDETNLEVEEIKTDEALNINDSSDGSVILLEDTKYEDDNKNESVEESGSNIIETVVDVDKVEIEEPKIEHSSSVIVIDDSKAEVSNDESVIQNKPLSALNTSLQKRHRKSSLTIQESIIIDGIKDPMLSKRINSLVESFCSTVKKGEIALNLSLEFEDSADNSSTKDSDKAESVHILSNVTICPGRDVNSEHKQKEEVEPEIEKELNTSVGHVKDLRQVINTNKLKRRLSKSIVNTEEKQEEEIEPNETEIEEELNTSVGQVEDRRQVINTNKLERRLSKSDVNTEQEQQEEDEPNEADNEEELSTSVDQMKDFRQAINRHKLKRRLSKSLTEINDEDKKAKRRKKNSKKDKKYSSDEKLNKKKTPGHKFRPDITEKDMIASFGLMNQLITDVKNRPRRLLKPTVTVESESSWIATKVSNLKPSTSPVSRHERIKVVPKLHPKDFKNQLLSDVGRVKRVETATLLKKKGVFL